MHTPLPCRECESIAGELAKAYAQAWLRQMMKSPIMLALRRKDAHERLTGHKISILDLPDSR